MGGHEEPLPKKSNEELLQDLKQEIFSKIENSNQMMEQKIQALTIKVVEMESKTSAANSSLALKVDTLTSELLQFRQASLDQGNRLSGDVASLQASVSTHLRKENQRAKEIDEIMQGKRQPTLEGLAGSTDPQIARNLLDFHKMLGMLREEFGQRRSQLDLFLSMIDLQQNNLLQILSAPPVQAAQPAFNQLSFNKPPSKHAKISFVHDGQIPERVIESVIESIQGQLHEFDIKSENIPIDTKSEHTPIDTKSQQILSESQFIFVLLRMGERMDDHVVQQYLRSLPDHIPKTVLMMKPRSNANFDRDRFERFNCIFSLMGFQQGGSSIFSCPQNDTVVEECASMVRGVCS